MSDRLDDPLLLGVVSNVWAALSGGSLEERCARAAAEGYRWVELRQGSLSEAEEAPYSEIPPMPLPEVLSRLAGALPGLRMNLAVEAPFLSDGLSVADPALSLYLEAAAALGGDPPVLRLVDVSRPQALLDHEEAQDELGVGLARFAVHAARRGVRLAVENSRQPLAAVRGVLRRARFGLPPEIPPPQLCWDPANQRLQTLAPEDPHEAAGGFAEDELWMVHFKQVAGGTVEPAVGPGELDWRRILNTLMASGFRGPALFELPPTRDCWEQLDQSRRYVNRLLAGGPG